MNKDITAVFGSNARKLILKQFVLSDEPLYMRDIERRTDINFNSIRREIKNLEMIGIIKFDHLHLGRHYYSFKNDKIKEVFKPFFT